jgi:hypothetical protein
MNPPGPRFPGRLDTQEQPFFTGFLRYPLRGPNASVALDTLAFFAIDPQRRLARPIRSVP